MEWKEVRLGDIVSIKSGLAYKGAFIGKGENILLGMGCVSFKDKFLFSGARPYEADCDDKYCVEPGDIVLATRQQSDNLPILAMPAIIPSSLKAKKIIYGTNLYKVENHSEVTNDFLFWQLKMPDYIDYISSVKTGSVVRMVTKKNVEDYVFRCPPKEVRDRISKLLWGLDRKIELNKKINADLEEMAQAIFKNWFVDFEPFKDGKFVDSELGMIPEGWKVGRLDEIADVVGGSTPSKAKPEYYTQKGIAWLTPKDLSNHPAVYTSRGEIDITEEGYNSTSTKLMPKGTILFTSRAPIGYISIAQNDICTNQGFKSLVPKKAGTCFLYCFLKYVTPEIENKSTGSTFKEASGALMKSLQVIMPEQKVFEDFETIVSPLFVRIESLENENSRLSLLRDTLLPRLMSGELEVPE
ncbi:restriction endonuclease subunit S [Segatella copri]|uniref:restriction endonuclease subunit S n=1 Tax=Segatella copri TaxID=165179 RepID=UPI001C46B74A|nr:restriction endonuclease subunit S [Segatella copri]MBW0048994.1 restriction endonuclease subunit S [Segatella copri]